jgi:hypothetical protein
MFIALDKLHKKCGSTGPLKHFRYRVRELLETDHLPDYSMSFDEKKDIVWFENRGTVQTAKPISNSIVLKASTFEEARSAAPGWDIYYLEQSWRSWMADGGLDEPKTPDSAFLGFCRKWFEKRGRP